MGWTEDFLDTPPRTIGPGKAKVKSGPAKQLRKDVIKAIQGLAYLGSRPCVTPVYTGQIPIEGKTYSLGRAGAADLILCWHSAFFALEIKTPNDRLRDNQKKYAERIAQAGGIYLEVRSAKQCVDFLIHWYNVNIAKIQPR